MDQLTEDHNIPVTHFGLEWIGSADVSRCSTVRKIKLLGMKGPYNYFNIFLPKKALEAKKDKEGTLHASLYNDDILCNDFSIAPTPSSPVPPPVPTATLDTLPDGPLGM